MPLPNASQLTRSWAHGLCSALLGHSPCCPAHNVRAAVAVEPGAWLQGLDWSCIRCFASTGEASAPQDSHWLSAQAGSHPVAPAAVHAAKRHVCAGQPWAVACSQQPEARLAHKPAVQAACHWLVRDIGRHEDLKALQAECSPMLEMCGGTGLCHPSAVL